MRYAIAMETALHLCLAWFGLGALGTVILLGARTLVSRSELPQEFSSPSDRLVAMARRPGKREVLKRVTTADPVTVGGSVAIRNSTSTDRYLHPSGSRRGPSAVESANLHQARRQGV
jgi:hypothetical protein